MNNKMLYSCRPIRCYSLTLVDTLEAGQIPHGHCLLLVYRVVYRMSVSHACRRCARRSDVPFISVVAAWLYFLGYYFCTFGDCVTG